MYASIKEALEGINYKDLAIRSGISKSTAYVNCAGKTHFLSPETARKIKAAYALDLSPFVRKPDQKKGRHSRWSLSAKRRLRYRRAAQKGWENRKRKENTSDDLPYLFIKTGKFTGIVIDKTTSKVLGKSYFLETKESA